jgi:hypothetical protein
MAACIFEGCRNDAQNEIGVRLRYPPQKNAVWAPDTRAYVCDEHARQGMRVHLTLEPTYDGEVETVVRTTTGGAAVTRRTPIVR